MQRVLSVAGVADAIHIATYYIGNILIEAQERMPSSNTLLSTPGSTALPRGTRDTEEETPRKGQRRDE